MEKVKAHFDYARILNAHVAFLLSKAEFSGPGSGTAFSSKTDAFKANGVLT